VLAVLVVLAVLAVMVVLAVAGERSAVRRRAGAGLSRMPLARE
jgi:Tfp pilus assembly protein FimT